MGSRPTGLSSGARQPPPAHLRLARPMRQATDLNARTRAARERRAAAASRLQVHARPCPHAHRALLSSGGRRHGGRSRPGCWLAAVARAAMPQGLPTLWSERGWGRVPVAAAPRGSRPDPADVAPRHTRRRRRTTDSHRRRVPCSSWRRSGIRRARRPRRPTGYRRAGALQAALAAPSLRAGHAQARRRGSPRPAGARARRADAPGRANSRR